MHARRPLTDTTRALHPPCFCRYCRTFTCDGCGVEHVALEGDCVPACCGAAFVKEDPAKAVVMQVCRKGGAMLHVHCPYEHLACCSIMGV